MNLFLKKVTVLFGNESLMLLEVGWPIGLPQHQETCFNSNLEIIVNNGDDTKSGVLIMKIITYWLRSI